MRLGAKLMRRAEFVQQIHRTRVEHNDTKLQCDGKRNARELIDWDRDSSLRADFACNTSSRTSSTITEASLQNNQRNRVSEQGKSIGVHSKKRSHDEDDLEDAKKTAAKS